MHPASRGRAWDYGGRLASCYIVTLLSLHVQHIYTSTH